MAIINSSSELYGADQTNSELILNIEVLSLVESVELGNTSNLILDSEILTVNESAALGNTSNLILDAEVLTVNESASMPSSGDLILDAEILTVNESANLISTPIQGTSNLILNAEYLSVVGFCSMESIQPPETKLLIDVALQKAGAKPANDNAYRARLIKVNDNSQVPIVSFRREKVFSEIAQTLQVNLGTWGLVHGLDKAATYRLEVGRQQANGTYLYESRGEFELASSSGSADKDNRQGSTSVYFVDTLVNKALKAPTGNIILYNPALIPAPQISDDVQIFDDSNNAVTTTVEAVPKLSLYKVLEKLKVYLSLADIVCAFPDFPVSKVNFSIENGYFDELINVLHDYEPAYDIFNNVLYVYDTGANYTGTVEKFIQQEAFDIEISKAKESRCGGVLVSYNDITSGGGSSIPGRFGWKYTITDEETTSGNGAYFYDDTVTRKQTYLALWCDLSTNKILSKMPMQEYTTVTKAGKLISKIDSYFEYDAARNRTATETRTSILVPEDNGSGGIVETLKEVTYERDTSSTQVDENNQPFQSQSAKVTRGLILVDHGDKKPNNAFMKTPLVDALKSNKYDPTDADHQLVYGVISAQNDGFESLSGQTIINQYKYSGTNESVDAKSTAVPGNNSLGREFGQFKESKFLVRSTDYPTSKVITLSFAETDNQNAELQARRKLKRLNDPPDRISLKLPYLDSTFRIGTVFQPVMKFPSVAAVGQFMVDGIVEEGSALGTKDQFIFLQLSGVKLLNADGVFAGLSFETSDGKFLSQLTTSLNENGISSYTAQFDVPAGTVGYKLILDKAPTGYTVAIRKSGTFGAFTNVDAINGVVLPAGSNGTTVSYLIWITANSSFASNFSRSAVNLYLKPNV